MYNQISTEETRIVDYMGETKAEIISIFCDCLTSGGCALVGSSARRLWLGWEQDRGEDLDLIYSADDTYEEVERTFMDALREEGFQVRQSPTMTPSVGDIRPGGRLEVSLSPPFGDNPVISVDFWESDVQQYLEAVPYAGQQVVCASFGSMGNLHYYLGWHISQPGMSATAYVLPGEAPVMRTYHPTAYNLRLDYRIPQPFVYLDPNVTPEWRNFVGTLEPLRLISEPEGAYDEGRIQSTEGVDPAPLPDGGSDDTGDSSAPRPSSWNGVPPLEVTRTDPDTGRVWMASRENQAAMGEHGRGPISNRIPLTPTGGQRPSNPA